MAHTPYYCISLAFGESPYPFYSPEEIKESLEKLETAEAEAEERLAQVRAAVKELNGLTCAAQTDAEARIRILDELSARREEAEALLSALREKRILLEEEWEEARLLSALTLP